MGKKINAWLGLGSAVILAAHVCYQVVAYAAFYHNEFITALLGHIIRTRNTSCSVFGIITDLLSR